jgi:hypothetical protein
MADVDPRDVVTMKREIVPQSLPTEGFPETATRKTLCPEHSTSPTTSRYARERE